MGLFDIFAKKSKPNLTPSIAQPTFEDLPFNDQDSKRGGYNLRNYAASRIRGENLGFGDDFVNKSTNPVIDKQMTRFRESTVPNINSQYSARGLGKSSLAADAVGKAERDVNQDINELVSKFYVLNESQKKTDQANAVALGERLNNQALGIETNRANASERLTDKQTEQTRLQNQANADQANAIGNLVASALTGGYSGGINGGGPAGALTGAIESVGKTAKANIAGNEVDIDELSEHLLKMGWLNG